MLKLIAYPALMLTALLMMGHTKSPSITNTSKPLPYLVFSGIPEFKKHSSVDKLKSDCYNLWQLGSKGISEAAFNYALKGYEYLNRSNLIGKKNILSIVDFSKSSAQKRLFVLDITTGEILFNTWVAHGKNSGSEYASRFSNLPESHQSSLGFYVTMDTYNGANGYSLRLKGCEKGINDKAYERAIVIHGADYVSTGFINSRGEVGRSYGCPALPVEMNRKIIDIIKNGSCIFIYHPTKKYYSKSRILNSQV